MIRDLGSTDGHESIDLRCKCVPAGGVAAGGLSRAGLPYVERLCLCLKRTLKPAH